jgi:hypothetical protein
MTIIRSSYPLRHIFRISLLELQLPSRMFLDSQKLVLPAAICSPAEAWRTTCRRGIRWQTCVPPGRAREIWHSVTGVGGAGGARRARDHDDQDASGARSSALRSPCKYRGLIWVCGYHIRRCRLSRHIWKRLQCGTHIWSRVRTAPTSLPTKVVFALTWKRALGI